MAPKAKTKVKRGPTPTKARTSGKASSRQSAKTTSAKAGASSIRMPNSPMISPRSAQQQVDSIALQGLTDFFKGNKNGKNVVGSEELNAANAAKRRKIDSQANDNGATGSGGNMKNGATGSGNLNEATGNNPFSDFDPFSGGENLLASPDEFGEMLKEMPNDFDLDDPMEERKEPEEGENEKIELDRMIPDGVNVVTTTTVVNPNNTVNIILGGGQDTQNGEQIVDISQELARDQKKLSEQGILRNSQVDINKTLAAMNDSGLMDLDQNGDVDPSKAVNLIMSSLPNIHLAEKLLTMDLDSLDPSTAAALLQDMLSGSEEEILVNGSIQTNASKDGSNHSGGNSSTAATQNHMFDANGNSANGNSSSGEEDCNTAQTGSATAVVEMIRNVSATSSNNASADSNQSNNMGSSNNSPAQGRPRLGTGFSNISNISGNLSGEETPNNLLNNTSISIEPGLGLNNSFFDSAPLMETAAALDLLLSDELLEILPQLDQLMEESQLQTIRKLIVDRKKAKQLREALDPIVIHATRTNAGVVGINNEVTHFTDPTGRMRYVGRIKSYARDKGNNSYGFIECPEITARYGGDAFLRRDQYLDCFEVGDKVSFILEISKDSKPQAVDLMTTDCTITPLFEESLRRREEESYYREMFGSQYRRPTNLPTPPSTSGKDHQILTTLGGGNGFCGKDNNTISSNHGFGGGITSGGITTSSNSMGKDQNGYNNSSYGGKDINSYWSNGNWSIGTWNAVTGGGKDSTRDHSGKGYGNLNSSNGNFPNGNFPNGISSNGNPSNNGKDGNWNYNGGKDGNWNGGNGWGKEGSWSKDGRGKDKNYRPDDINRDFERPFVGVKTSFERNQALMQNNMKGFKNQNINQNGGMQHGIISTSSCMNQKGGSMNHNNGIKGDGTETTSSPPARIFDPTALPSPFDRAVGSNLGSTEVHHHAESSNVVLDVSNGSGNMMSEAMENKNKNYNIIGNKNYNICGTSESIGSGGVSADEAVAQAVDNAMLEQGSTGQGGSLEEILASINQKHKELHGVNDIPKQPSSTGSVNKNNPTLTPRSRIRAPPEARDVMKVPRKGEKPRSEANPHFSQFGMRNANAKQYEKSVEDAVTIGSALNETANTLDALNAIGLMSSTNSIMNPIAAAATAATLGLTGPGRFPPPFGLTSLPPPSFPLAAAVSALSGAAALASATTGSSWGPSGYKGSDSGGYNSYKGSDNGYNSSSFKGSYGKKGKDGYGYGGKSGKSNNNSDLNRSIDSSGSNSFRGRESSVQKGRDAPGSSVQKGNSQNSQDDGPYDGPSDMFNINMS